MMARLNVRLPILTIEREAPFFWVSLGLREAHVFGAMGVQDFESVAIGDGDDGAGKIGRLTTRPSHNPFGHHVNLKDCPPWQPSCSETVLCFPAMSGVFVVS